MEQDCGYVLEVFARGASPKPMVESLVGGLTQHGGSPMVSTRSENKIGSECPRAPGAGLQGVNILGKGHKYVNFKGGRINIKRNTDTLLNVSRRLLFLHTYYMGVYQNVMPVSF